MSITYTGEKTGRIYHPFGPLYNGNSHVLILGSFPSVKSREQEFFYGHPQNRFWKVIAALFPEIMAQIQNAGNIEGIQQKRDESAEAGSSKDALAGGNVPEAVGVESSMGTILGADSTKGKAGIRVPDTIEEKKALILGSGLALWDSIASCEITGSSDSSIRNAEPNDLRVITDNCDIRAIYCNGKKSLEVYNKYILPVLGREAEALPSTSPANAAWSLDRLIEAWAAIRSV